MSDERRLENTQRAGEEEAFEDDLEEEAEDPAGDPAAAALRVTAAAATLFVVAYSLITGGWYTTNAIGAIIGAAAAISWLYVFGGSGGKELEKDPAA